MPRQPFTFDPTALTAAKVATGHREERPRLGTAAPPPPDDVALDDLIGFFKDPVKGFFRALDYTLPWDVDAVEDAMPVEIDALQEWKVGDRMLDDMLRGMKPEDARRRSGGADHCRRESSAGARRRKSACRSMRSRPPRNGTARRNRMRTMSTSMWVRAGASRAPSRGCTATGWSRSITRSSTDGTCWNRGFAWWR